MNIYWNIKTKNIPKYSVIQKDLVSLISFPVSGRYKLKEHCSDEVIERISTYRNLIVLNFQKIRKLNI